MTSSPRRTLIISRRLVEPHVSSASAYEFEDVVAEVENADLLSVALVDTRAERAVAKLSEHLQRVAGLSMTLNKAQQRTALDTDYDLLFVRVMEPGDLAVLDAVPEARKRCRVAVCWVEELWVPWLEYEKLLRPLAQFDHVFVAHAATVERLGAKIRRPCSYLPPGVDALRFFPGSNPPPRSIAVYAMGRRLPRMHAALLERARKATDFLYLCDTARVRELVDGHAQHREQLARLIARTRYFVVNRAKVNAPDTIQGQQEFGPRFFEGAAGGAILIGDAPEHGPFLSYFDWPDAMCRLPYDSPDVCNLIDSLEAQPERVEAARRENLVNTLRRHDWLYRWQLVLDTLALAPGPAATARRAELERRASAIGAAGPSG